MLDGDRHLALLAKIRAATLLLAQCRREHLRALVHIANAVAIVVRPVNSPQAWQEIIHKSQIKPLGFADDEAMLDEEALRQMVSDLVREELQGVLGERITRNVRRLVRREIQRAMALRDLE